MSVTQDAAVETKAAPAQRQPSTGERLLLLLLEGRTLIVLIALIIVFTLLSDSYLTQSNLIVMTKHVSITALLAIAAGSIVALPL